MTIYERLISLSDASYQEFQRKLIPTLDGEKIIGVRMPEIRRLAKEVYEVFGIGRTFKKDITYPENFHCFSCDITDNNTLSKTLQTIKT